MILSGVKKATDRCHAVCTDAYSVKHITYKWQDGPSESVKLADEVQLPQVQVKGYRVREKLEVLSTGLLRRSLAISRSNLSLFLVVPPRKCFIVVYVIITGRVWCTYYTLN